MTHRLSLPVIAARLATTVAMLLLLSGCLTGKSTSSDSDTLSESRSQSSNTAPSISGNPPPAVKIGSNYRFRPVATDQDGDKLHFDINNKPSWANFNAENGELSGQAPPGAEGEYEDITISVSDGASSVSLRPFSVSVMQDAAATLTVSWQPPSLNDDETPLLDLQGYKIYYGTLSRQYDRVINVSNPGVTTFLIEGLVPGKYYVAVTSYTSERIESDFSNELSGIAR